MTASAHRHPCCPTPAVAGTRAKEYDRHQCNKTHKIYSSCLRYLVHTVHARFAYFYATEHVVVKRQLLQLLESWRVPAAAYHLDAVRHELGGPAHDDSNTASSGTTQQSNRRYCIIHASNQSTAVSTTLYRALLDVVSTNAPPSRGYFCFCSGTSMNSSASAHLLWCPPLRPLWYTKHPQNHIAAHTARGYTQGFLVQYSP